MSAILVVIAIGVGLAGGAMALAFYHAIEGVIRISHVLGAAPHSIIVAASLGGLVCGLLVHFFAREAKGHGVPEVMQAISVRGGVIRPRVVLVKALASAVTIGTGGSAGREGPIVQIGGALGSMLGQICRVPRDHLKLLVACGAAAGIAATFKTPIAGSVFAMEVILREYSPAAFGLSVISAVAASTLMNQYGTGPVFQVPPYELSGAAELLLYALLGVLAMAMAQFYIKMLYASEDMFDGWHRCPGFLKPAVGGVLFGIIGIGIPLSLGRGEGVVEAMLAGNTPEMLVGLGAVSLAPWLWLAILAIAKLLSTTATIGSGGSGGVFFPGLYIGAATGGAFGNIAHIVLPAIVQHPGAYALVGMGATFAAMTQAPFTAILMIFEMTRNYWMILPLMTACVAASLLSAAVSKDNIYTLKLTRSGIPLPGPSHRDVMHEVRVSEAMTSDVLTVSEEATLAYVVRLMQETNHTGFPVVDKEGMVTGMITLSDVRKSELKGRLERKVREISTHRVLFVEPDDTLETALHKLSVNRVGRLVVISGEDRTLKGLITRTDIIRAYDRHVTA